MHPQRYKPSPQRPHRPPLRTARVAEQAAAELLASLPHPARRAADLAGQARRARFFPA